MGRDWQEWLADLDPRVAYRGGEAYLPLDTALGALALIEASGGIVVGMEGFWLAPGATRPSMEHIADYSELAGRDDGPELSAAAARDALEAWRGEVDAVVLVVDAGDIPGR
jgi:hypothetical protein